MPSTVTLDDTVETFVRDQLASGRYSDAHEVVHDALRLLQDRQHRRATLEAALTRGVADMDAGRVHDADDVFDAAEARYKVLAQQRDAP